MAADCFLNIPVTTEKLTAGNLRYKFASLPGPWPLGRAAFAGNTDHCGETSLHVLFCSRPGRDANAHRCLALPDCACAPAGTILLDTSYHFAGHVRAAEGHQHLIDHHIIQHCESCFPETLREPLCMSARPLDQCAQPRAAQRF